MEYLACYLAAVNILLCALMGTDKLLAKLQKRRIPEKLFLPSPFSAERSAARSVCTRFTTKRCTNPSLSAFRC